MALLALVPKTKISPSVGARTTPPGDRSIVRETDSNLTEGFGSSISLKAANSLRIGFQNIGGFSSKNNSLKDDIIHSGLKL
jgi:hypothetical protein